MDEKEIRRIYADLERAARDAGLEIFHQDLEVHMEDRSHMVSLLARSGMPVRYPHWSFGGKGERQWQRIRRGEGLGYSSLFLPTNPPRLFVLDSISPARLLTALARSLAYQDFCARNEYLVRVDYNRAWRAMREHENFVHELFISPSIENDLLQMTIDAGHAVARQTSHAVWGRGRDDILRALVDMPQLTQWQKDLLGIIRQEWIDLLPLYETWGMRMGYGALWEQRLLERVDLPAVVRLAHFGERASRLSVPDMGPVNVTRIFSKIFERLEREHTATVLRQIVSSAHDSVFIQQHLTQDVAIDSGLLAWAHGEENPTSVVITELSTDSGWEKARDILVRESGSNKFPAFFLKDTLTYFNVGSSAPKRVEGFILLHDFDGRFLNSSQQQKSGDLLARLIGKKVSVITQHPTAQGLAMVDYAYEPSSVY